MSPPGSAATACNNATASGRPRDERRRHRLLTQAAELLVDRQSYEVSLRKLADALKTSSRMLVHHFGSRDALIAAALAHARSHLLDTCRAPRPSPTLAATSSTPAARSSRSSVLRISAASSAPSAAITTDPASRPFFRLLDEVNALAQTQPDRFPGFGRASVHDWLPNSPNC